LLIGKEQATIPIFLGSLFYDAFSVTRLYNVDDRVKVDDYDEQMRTNIHALCGIRTHGLNIQAIKPYASDRAASGTGYSDIPHWFSLNEEKIKFSFKFGVRL
jgi:hypothetical protein